LLCSPLTSFLSPFLTARSHPSLFNAHFPLLALSPTLLALLLLYFSSQ
jgi:hypothetical protein